MVLNPCMWQHGERWGGVGDAKHEEKQADFRKQIHKMPAKEPRALIMHQDPLQLIKEQQHYGVAGHK